MLYTSFVSFYILFFWKRGGGWTHEAWSVIDFLLGLCCPYLIMNERGVAYGFMFRSSGVNE